MYIQDKNNLKKKKKDDMVIKDKRNQLNYVRVNIG